MSITNVLPRAEQFDTMNALLAAIASGEGRLTPKSFADVQSIVRLGLAEKIFHIGDQIVAERLAGLSASVGDSTGISAATVAEPEWISAHGVRAGTYEVSYDGAAWNMDGAPVSLSVYGISVTGNATEGDHIVITETTNEITFDVAAFDYDSPVDANLTHSMTLLAHDVVSYSELPFDKPELLYAVTAASWPTGMPAGTYDITLDAGAYSGGTEQDGIYQFTLTQPIPVGGGIKHTTIGVYQSGSYTPDQIVAGKFSSYDATGTAIETNLATTKVDSAGGTMLGTATASNPLKRVTAAMNYTQRNAYGSNRWKESCDRQWMNSNLATGWWARTTIFDMPCASPAKGWLYGLDPELVAVLGEVKKRVAIPACDGGSYEDLTERVFMASMTELGLGTNNSVYETSFGTDNTIKASAYPLYDGAVQADRIKYKDGTARSWWLRSPYPSDASYERLINPTGELNGSLASNSSGVVPGLCII